MNKKGITLIAALILIIFAAIVILGVTHFIVQRIRQFTPEQGNLRAIYLAQAGLNRAIYDFREIGFFTLHEYGYETCIDDLEKNNNCFSLYCLGSNERFMVATHASYLSGAHHNELTGLYMRDADHNPITFNIMQLTWLGPKTLRLLKEVWIAGSLVWKDVNGVPPGTNLPIVFTLEPGQVYSLKFVFDDDMCPGPFPDCWTIDARFVFTMGNDIKDVRLYPASDNYNFTIRVTGKADQQFLRTIRTDYNAYLNATVSYHEE